MENGKLIATLKSFDGWDWRNCRIFLESGLSGVGEAELRVFDRLKELLAEEGDLEKETLWSSAFGDTPFHKGRYRYLLTDLNRGVESFLIWQKLSNDEVGRDLYLMQAYRNRELPRHFERTLKRGEQRLEKQSKRDGAYHLRKYMLREAAANFSMEHQNRDTALRLESLTDELDAFFLGTKLKYSAEMLNRANILGIKEEPRLWEEVMAFCEQEGEDLPPLVKIYRQVSLTLTQAGNEEHYYRLLDLLEEFGELFEADELGAMYGFGVNYCIKKINQGNVGYQEQLFELYVILVGKHLLFDGDYLPPQHFKNICTLALRLKKFTWTEEFIREYSQTVQPGHADNARTYNLAFLHFARQEYGDSLRLLQQVEFSDVFYHLDSKSLLLRTYYELDEVEPLLSLIDTFRIYLKRNKKISGYQQRVYMNLVRFVKKLVRLRLGSRTSGSQIKKEIMATPEISDRRWLLSKLEEFDRISP